MKEQVNVIVVNALSYKTSKNEGTRLQLILIDKTSLSDNEKFKGYTTIDIFVNSKVFNDLKINDIMQKAVLEFERIFDSRRPLNSTIKPTSLIVNDVCINL